MRRSEKGLGVVYRDCAPAATKSGTLVGLALFLGGGVGGGAVDVGGWSRAAAVAAA